MTPEVSVVIPVYNEAENVEPLAHEITAALRARFSFEMIFVDDGSTDGTAEAARRARDSGIPELRLLRHSARGGQSAAVLNGVRAARAEWIATLDGDGQNDPADLPRLLDARASAGNEDVALFIGNRRASRKDSWLRRVSSLIANGVRSRMLGDATPDTGCGLKLFRRDVFLTLPAFDHMHRFLPVLVQRAGFRAVSLPVSHRPRLHGVSKYGVHNRLWVGIVDLFGVMWLRARARPGLRVAEE